MDAHSQSDQEGLYLRPRFVPVGFKVAVDRTGPLSALLEPFPLDTEFPWSPREEGQDFCSTPRDQLQFIEVPTVHSGATADLMLVWFDDLCTLQQALNSLKRRGHRLADMRELIGFMTAFHPVVEPRSGLVASCTGLMIHDRSVDYRFHPSCVMVSNINWPVIIFPTSSEVVLHEQYFLIHPNLMT